MLPSTVHLSLSFYLLFVVKFFPFAIRPLSLSLSVTLQLCPSLYPRTADTHTSIIQYMDSCCHPQKALSPLSLSLSLSLSLASWVTSCSLPLVCIGSFVTFWEWQVTLFASFSCLLSFSPRMFLHSFF